MRPTFERQNGLAEGRGNPTRVFETAHISYVNKFKKKLTSVSVIRLVDDK